MVASHMKALSEMSRIAKKAEEGYNLEDLREEFLENFLEICPNARFYIEFLRNRRPRILLVGDKKSIFIRRLVRNLKLCLGNNIRISIWGICSKESYPGLEGFPDFFDSDYSYELPSGLREIRNPADVIRRIVEVDANVHASMWKAILESDVVHIHYLSGWGARFILPSYLLMFPRRKLIATIWGSDMFVESRVPVRRVMQKTILNLSRVITLANATLAKIFCKIYGEKYRKKIRIACFGTGQNLEGFDKITKKDKEKFAKKYAVDTGKIVIIVGSSADYKEHHEYILDEIAKLKDDIKKNLFLVVPVTYGDKHTRDLVKKHFNSIGLEGVVIDKYMSDKEVMVLRSIADITIFIPQTDAFSSFLLESLYAGNVVITGSWLPYDWINDNNIYCHRLNSIREGELKNLLLKILNNIDEERKKASYNKDPVRRLAAWQYRVVDWLKVYSEVLSNEGGIRCC